MSLGAETGLGKEENREDNYGKNELHRKLHNFARPLLRERELKVGSGFSYQEVMLTISLSSATSDEISGVEVLVLTLETTTLLRE
ncbi:hypothetical protein Tco_1548294 [Tanacetum coccineum]